jgi:hypothetical protein
VRVALIGLLVVVALTGCSAAGRAFDAAPPAVAAGPISADATGAVPANDLFSPQEDASGQTPDQVVAALTDALSRRDWKTAYSLYATPTTNAEIAAKEWSEANERYTALTARETRVVDSESAWVRVTYTLIKAPTGSSAYSLVVTEPGEWWPVYKVAGQWRVGWMPRQ